MDYEKWYKRQPELMTKAKGATILRDFTIQTDKKKISSNWDDIAVKDYKRKTWLLIDFSEPIDHISPKEYDK